MREAAEKAQGEAEAKAKREAEEQARQEAEAVRNPLLVTPLISFPPQIVNRS